MKLSLQSLFLITALFPLSLMAKDFNVERLAAIDAIKKATIVNNEVNTIKFRREIMGQAGLNLYVIFLSDKGQPIDYFMTDGKCSSSKKHLVNKYKKKTGYTGKDSDGDRKLGDFFIKGAGVDGTHGSSTPYIYCLTPDGKYKQWGGRYYISSAPLELSIKPMVTKKV